MSHIVHENRRQRPIIGPVIVATVAALAFAAGALFSHPGAPWRAWTWDSPWTEASLIVAALWAGIAVTSLVLTRLRDVQADRVVRQIEEAQAHAQSLIAAIDAAPAQSAEAVRRKSDSA